MDGTDEHGSADWAAGYAESHQDWIKALGEVPNAPTSPSEAVERILRLEAEAELLRAQLRLAQTNSLFHILSTGPFVSWPGGMMESDREKNWAVMDVENWSELVDRRVAWLKLGLWIGLPASFVIGLLAGTLL